MSSTYRPMNHRRRPRNWNSGPTPVNLTWSFKYSAYALKFENTFHFDEMQPILTFLRSKPYGEYTYDPDSKIWYFDPKWLKDVRTLLDAFGPNIFTVNFQEKPPENNNWLGSRVISVREYLDKFKILTNQDIMNLDYKDAKKIYRRFCMQNHPDKGGDASIMSAVNEIWSVLESKHFKTKQEVVYESPTTIST